MKILIDGPRIGMARTNLKCLGPWNVRYSAAACVMSTRWRKVCFPKNGSHKNSSIKIWCPLQIHSKFQFVSFFCEKAFFGSIENFYAVIFFVDFEAVQFAFGLPLLQHKPQAFERGWPVVAVLLYRKHVVCLGGNRGWPLGHPRRRKKNSKSQRLCLIIILGMMEINSPNQQAKYPLEKVQENKARENDVWMRWLLAEGVSRISVGISIGPWPSPLFYLWEPVDCGCLQSHLTWISDGFKLKRNL